MTPREDLDGSGGHAVPDAVPPVPDEDGPHDVPDDAVIEATLPTAPGPLAGEA